MERDEYLTDTGLQETPETREPEHAGFECGKYCDCSGCYKPCARPDDHSGAHRCRRHMDSCFD